ncbi:MAG: NUDIX domain-containing protein [Defluviitaleaceae bacterium]|nr:NUDIX domain-containing protein [Defluviitaleaceae bacterium]
MENLDCGFTKGSKWFRYRAAAVIIENSNVLVVGNEGVDFFYSIGGGVHHGETAEEAVLREVFEETGVRYEIDRLLYIHENLFKENNVPSLKGLSCHEICFYFLMKSRGSQELNSNSYTEDGKEFMKWIPIHELKNYTVYPAFFVDKLHNITKNIEHIITRK